MGIWGYKLYDDDVACDTKSAFAEKIKSGMTSEIATKSIIDEFKEVINDEDDSVVFWLALADTQWRFGRLQPTVKEKALELLNNGGDVARWIDEGRLNEAKKRGIIFEKLKEKLNSPQPRIKNTLERINYTREWRIGDVLAYRLGSDLAKEKGFYGRYILLQKVNEYATMPVYRARISEGTELPNIESFNDLEYVKIMWNTLFKTYGYLFLLQKVTKKIIREKLVHLGNAEIIPPPKQSRPEPNLDCDDNIWWPEFEEHIVTSYCKYNLGQE